MIPEYRFYENMVKKHLEMSAIKNLDRLDLTIDRFRQIQIYLYCYFNEIMNGLETSFQSPALSQTHAGNMCYTVDQYLTKFHFDSTSDPK